jgi:glycosyltransferase involved in cell wall biosynthesis
MVNGRSGTGRRGESALKILHIVSYYEPAFGFGGILRAVSGTCRALAVAGHEVSVFTTDASDEGRLEVPLYRPQNRDGVAVTHFPLTWRGWPLGRFYYARTLAAACAARIQEFDVAHLSTLWGHTAIAGSRACVRGMVPYVVSPHGSLEPWGYAQKGWKKRLHMALCARRILDRANAIHAICPAEAHNLEQFGLQGKITCIPNGIDTSEFADLPPPAEAEERWPALRGRRVILFLSRLHHVKGLDRLVPAFAALRRHCDDAFLVVAGPDDGYLRKLNALIDTYAIRDDVLLTGMLTGRDRLLAFAAADVFVLPSHSDVLAIAVIEAMACALPVVITPACNFPEVAQAGAGLILEPTAPELAAALEHVVGMSDDQRGAMGARGRRLVESGYTWDVIARKMLTVYQCAIDGKPVPLHPEPQSGGGAERCDVVGRTSRGYAPSHPELPNR